MKKKIIGLAAGFLMLPFVAQAAVVSFESRVTQVIPLASGDFMLAFQDVAPTCTNPDRNFYVMVGKSNVTVAGSEKIYAAALSAAATRSRVQVLFDDGYRFCYISQFKVMFDLDALFKQADIEAC